MKEFNTGDNPQNYRKTTVKSPVEEGLPDVFRRLGAMAVSRDIAGKVAKVADRLEIVADAALVIVPVVARAGFTVLRILAPIVLVAGGVFGTGYLLYQGVVQGIAWLKAQPWTMPVLYIVLAGTVLALAWQLVASSRSTGSGYSSSKPYSTGVQLPDLPSCTDGRTIIIINQNNQTLEK